MSGYRKILVAVDGSNESMIILEKAIKVSTSGDSHLDVVVVFQPPPGDYSFEMDMTDFQHAQQRHRDEVTRQLRAMMKVRFPVIGAEAIHFCDGKPVSEIKDMATKLGSDLLVIGGHAKDPLRTMLGSTTSGVLHGIHCDVLVVRV